MSHSPIFSASRSSADALRPPKPRDTSEPISPARTADTDKRSVSAKHGPRPTDRNRPEEARRWQCISRAGRLAVVHVSFVSVLASHSLVWSLGRSETYFDHAPTWP